MGFSTLAAYRLELEHQLSSIGLKLGLNCMASGLGWTKSGRTTIKEELTKTGGKRIVVDFQIKLRHEWPRN